MRLGKCAPTKQPLSTTLELSSLRPPLLTMSMSATPGIAPEPYVADAPPVTTAVTPPLVS